MKIEPVRTSELDICVDIIFESGLGKRYYVKKELLKAKMDKARFQDKIYLAKEEKNNIGVLWYQLEGMFLQYPYLHMIALSNFFLHSGYGKKLIEFYEKNIIYSHGGKFLGTKLFLLVAEDNTHAQEFYKKIGYEEMGRFPHLFRKGITEILMMKKLRFHSQQLLPEQ